MTTKTMTGAFVAAVLAAFVCAAEAQAPPMPKPAPEMAGLTTFEGNWTCEGVMPPGPMGPGGKSKGSVQSQRGFGGFWQVGKVKSSMPGMPSMEGTFHMTYDPVARKYLMLWVDNMGGWAQITSPGWEGDTMTFTGDTLMAGQKMTTRDVFTKAADGSFRHEAEMQMDGKWTTMGDETCRKAAAR